MVSKLVSEANCLEQTEDGDKFVLVREGKDDNDWVDDLGMSTWKKLSTSRSGSSKRLLVFWLSGPDLLVSSIDPRLRYLSLNLTSLQVILGNRLTSEVVDTFQCINCRVSNECIELKLSIVWHRMLMRWHPSAFYNSLKSPTPSGHK